MILKFNAAQSYGERKNARTLLLSLLVKSTKRLHPERRSCWCIPASIDHAPTAHLALSRIQESYFVLCEFRGGSQLGVREAMIENELPLGGIADLRSDTTGQANEVWKTGKIIANLS